MLGEGGGVVDTQYFGKQGSFGSVWGFGKMHVPRFDKASGAA